MIEPTGENRGCPAPERAAMGGGVDAPRHAGNNGKSRRAKIASDALGKQKRGRRAFARSNDGDGWALQ